MRDLVTLLAAQTRTDAADVAGIYNAGASLEWQFGSESDRERTVQLGGAGGVPA